MISTLINLGTKINKRIQFTYKMVNLKIIWNHFYQKMKIILAMFISKILTNLYIIKQSIKNNNFARTVHNASIVKKHSQIIGKLG